ncbi:hypothetical protein HF325_003349 [Metschnikowia pulcherrima]|uniref:Dienelactone hydrolase domain-containing protein n=1 Tax=Metschnikowia pulcherrima TaxID=27326 RepID=A0A8H7LBL0_9ASCO|nr:hypothetical protein HF325_003349 [Metschnikowia pulcherrima]
MASNKPGLCCAAVNFHEGTPIGNYETVYGLDTYVVGHEHTRIIVIITDAFGHKLNNTLLIADEFARAGYKVYIPDVLEGDAFSGPIQEIFEWLPKHSFEVTAPIVNKFLQELREEAGVSAFVGVIGYCFGAKFAIPHLAVDGIATAGAVAHPSSVAVEEISAIRKPIIISAAETDPVFAPELRHQTEAKLAEIKARYQLTLFSGVEHGFAVRGDIKDPVVKYAKEKTLADQLQWFSLF